MQGRDAQAVVRMTGAVVAAILRFRNRVLQDERPNPAAVMSPAQLIVELIAAGYKCSPSAHSSYLISYARTETIHAWQSLETWTAADLRQALRRIDPSEVQTHRHLDKNGLLARIQEVRARKKDADHQKLVQRISSVSRSGGMWRLTEANWMIADAVEYTLTRLLEGDMEIAFSPGSMPTIDGKSRALYMLMVDAIRAKVVAVCQSEDLLHADSLLCIAIERPTMTAVHAATEQYRRQNRYRSCPFCAKRFVLHNRSATSREPCGCHAGFDLQHLLLANGIANEVFLRAEEIFQAIIAFDQSTAPSNGAARTSVPVPETLVEAIRAFVTSPEMVDLDEKELRLQRLFAKAFTALLQRTSRPIAFPAGNVDPESTHLFAVIWRKWMRQLEVARSAMSADAVRLWTLCLEEPSLRADATRNQSQRDLSIEELTRRCFATGQMEQQRYPCDARTRLWMQFHSRAIVHICHQIVNQDGSGDTADPALVALLQLGRFYSSQINASVLLMRQGVRELPSLVPDNLDSTSASIVEALLRVVITIESDPLHFEAFVRQHGRQSGRGAGSSASYATPTASTEAGSTTVTFASDSALIDTDGSESGKQNPPEDTAVEAFRSFLPSSGVAPAHQNDHVVMMIRILNKILDSEEMRYRRLSLSHGAVATALVPHEGAVALLEAAGFQRDGEVLIMQTVDRPLLTEVIVQLSKMLHGPEDDAAIYGP